MPLKIGWCLGTFLLVLAGGLLGPSGTASAQVVYCNGVRYWGACPQAYEPPPYVPQILQFAGRDYLRRCELLDVQTPSELAEWKQRLRNDAFAPALQVFVDDLDKAEAELRGLSEQARRYSGGCSDYFKDAVAFDRAAREWNQSVCVTGVEVSQSAWCSAKQSELSTQRDDAIEQLEKLAGESDRITGDFRGAANRVRRAVQNAQTVLDPDNTEEVLRLYIWRTIFGRYGHPPENSCHAFADIATALGKRVQRQDLFIKYLARNVIEPRTDIRIIAGSPPARPLSGRDFNAKGFKSKYFNELSENQVRHAAAFMVTGYEFTGGPGDVGSLFLDLLQKGETGDFQLAISSGQLGFRLSRGVISAAGFGNALRNELCQ